eukprot:jgi/Botrbrau1/12662/Bobra.67_1s0027.1
MPFTSRTPALSLSWLHKPHPQGGQSCGPLSRNPYPLLTEDSSRPPDPRHSASMPFKVYNGQAGKAICCLGVASFSLFFSSRVCWCSVSWGWHGRAAGGDDETGGISLQSIIALFYRQSFHSCASRRYLLMSRPDTEDATGPSFLRACLRRLLHNAGLFLIIIIFFFFFVVFFKRRLGSHHLLLLLLLLLCRVLQTPAWLSSSSSSSSSSKARKRHAVTKVEGTAVQLAVLMDTAYKT